MTRSINDSRRDLRERAFQTLFSLEFGGDHLTAVTHTYTYDKSDDSHDVPLFLLNLVNGVIDHRAELDELIIGKLKAGWSLSRLTLTDKTILRLGLYEILYETETPSRVAINEAIELAKNYSDDKSSRFINGVLSQFITEDDNKK